MPKKTPLYPHVPKKKSREWEPPTERELGLMTVQIHLMDYDILKKIAEHDGISIAHALSAQFSGWGLYKK